ncbi:MAG TPA: YHYH protein, partial [Herpetosiphonaceae bacterium]|nr:YHYH protein [Herpetosiphonaceae bacterium]
SLPGFADFAGQVAVRSDGEYIYVESNGLPAHPMMIGIRSWQQQVPLPQPYAGANAWRIPLAGTLADQPISARTGLFRGAIALAVNGVPIFNALNNRGEDALEAGELDQWGGHAGRADDYHYHVAPLHLQDQVGPGAPIAYALDGFPIYGLTEPDGSPATGLDEFNGHVDAAGNYHYHASQTYPYINGGMRGAVAVRDDQIDPQPRTAPARPAGQPLRGATVTEFSAGVDNSFALAYQLAGETYRISYALDGDECTFTFTDPSGASRSETFSRAALTR